jgi:prepilin-type processing-associated H-X9-DG protein
MNRLFRSVSEVIVIVILIAILAMLGFARLTKTKTRRVASECRLNQRSLDVLFRAFCADHDNQSVTSVPTARGGSMEFAADATEMGEHFKALLSFPYSNLATLVCPTDRRSPPTSLGSIAATNISYFLTVTPPDGPDSVVCGDRNLFAGPGFATIGGTTGWHAELGLHGSNGYIAFFDGSVRWINAAQVPSITASNKTNRVVVP